MDIIHKQSLCTIPTLKILSSVPKTSEQELGLRRTRGSKSWAHHMLITWGQTVSP